MKSKFYNLPKYFNLLIIWEKLFLWIYKNEIKMKNA